jgi:hypothetical protein
VAVSAYTSILLSYVHKFVHFEVQPAPDKKTADNWVPKLAELDAYGAVNVVQGWRRLDSMCFEQYIHTYILLHAYLRTYILIRTYICIHMYIYTLYMHKCICTCVSKAERTFEVEVCLQERTVYNDA